MEKMINDAKLHAYTIFAHTKLGQYYAHLIVALIQILIDHLGKITTGARKRNSPFYSRLNYLQLYVLSHWAKPRNFVT